MSITSDPAANPYLSGIYEPVSDELVASALHVDGEIPLGLRGSYLRNGPNPLFTPIGRYHIFDGDGMVHGVQLADGQATYRNRYVEGRALAVERKAGKALYGGLGEMVFPPQEIMEEGGLMKNTANTNIVRHAGKYLALMEAAHPTEMDADLNTIGEYTFDGALHGAMTAHPKWDPVTGEMHFFGYSPFPPYLRYHVAEASGRLIHSTDLELPGAVMMHDFVITSSSVIFFDLPAVFDIDAMMSGGAGIRWQPDSGARIGVMPRLGSGTDVRWIEIEPCYVFHFLNAWDASDSVGDSQIVVDGCRAAALPTAFGDEAMPDGDVRPSLHRWRINPSTGDVSMEQLDDRPADFPRINDEFTGAENRYGYLGHVGAWEDENVVFTGVTQWDLQRDESTTHVYGPTHSCGETVFAADPSGTAENDGWLLNIVTDMSEGTSRLVILDARDIGAGSVAEVHLPQRVPSGFHGNWMPDEV